MSTAQADHQSSSLTPTEILNRLKQRISELEAQLADAQRDLSDRRRLQDLSPEELALVAVGSAGEIIKAARSQAADVRAAAENADAQARQKAQATFEQARERAARLTPESLPFNWL